MTTLTIEKLYREQIQYLSRTELETLMQLIQSRLPPHSNDKHVRDLPIMLQIEPGKSALQVFQKATSYQALAQYVLDNLFMAEESFIDALSEHVVYITADSEKQAFEERLEWLHSIARKCYQVGFLPQSDNQDEQVIPTLTDYKTELGKYRLELNDFEQQYGMPSAEFYKKFEAGQLGDAMDFFDWSGLFELTQHLHAKITQLEMS
ncbi:MAG: hypothetical protein B6242_13485 [Anaerolineaceae bacterium 4572_78]|nr:MAG: hypothetical protein B6242_13485 [Anaerolineaceae bacterium 4572_78]